MIAVPLGGEGSGIFGNNILHLSLGRALSDKEILTKLTNRPAKPLNDMSHSLLQRNYELNLLKKIRFPTGEMLSLFRTIDLMMHNGYLERNPENPVVWRLLSSEISKPLAAEPGQTAFVSGLSGLGKTKTVQGALGSYVQVYWHPIFPRCVGGLRQLCWLYIQMPPSGKMSSFIDSLIHATAHAFDDPTLIQALRPNPNDLVGSFQKWTRFVQSHFLGILVIDEIQNLFKLQTLKQRAAKNIQGAQELRLSDDVTLKVLMNFIDTSGIPLLMIGTPDASGVLQKRFAVSQRLTTGGEITFKHAVDADCNDFVRLLKVLEEYQWSDTRLIIDDELRKFIHIKTAGVRRLVISLWYASHRVAIDRGARNLKREHFEIAAKDSLRSSQPAVNALLSGYPSAMAMFEDLKSASKVAPGT